MLMRGEGRGEMHRVTAAATQPLGLFDFADFGHLLCNRFLYPGIESQRRGGTSITGPQKTHHCLVARYFDQFGIADRVSYISTGGGAFLEYVEGKTLPAVAVLEERAREAG